MISVVSVPTVVGVVGLVSVPTVVGVVGTLIHVCVGLLVFRNARNPTQTWFVRFDCAESAARARIVENCHISLHRRLPANH